MGDSAVVLANDRVRTNVECLMEMRRMTQAELAEQIGKSQPWLSKRLTGATPFQIEDLDLVGDAFGLSPAQLLQDGYGKRDRRCGEERRSGADRRQIGERFNAAHGRHRSEGTDSDRRSDVDRRTDDEHPQSRV
jgi:transcriptional regulator with XRE-family HTH domain